MHECVCSTHPPTIATFDAAWGVAIPSNTLKMEALAILYVPYSEYKLAGGSAEV